MISIARLLISQSPSPTVQQKSAGWLELPNGRRVKPTPAQAYFAPWSDKPYMPSIKKRRRWFNSLLNRRA